MSMRTTLAHWLRLWADLIDWQGAPKQTHLSFTFESGRGVVVNEDSRGCPLWYYGDHDYELAHTAALQPAPRWPQEQ